MEGQVRRLQNVRGCQHSAPKPNISPDQPSRLSQFVEFGGEKQGWGEGQRMRELCDPPPEWWLSPLRPLESQAMLLALVPPPTEGREPLAPLLLPRLRLADMPGLGGTRDRVRGDKMLARGGKVTVDMWCASPESSPLSSKGPLSCPYSVRSGNSLPRPGWRARGAHVEER